MHEALVSVIKRNWPDVESVEIHELAVLAGGYSRETYRFDCTMKRGGEFHHFPFILRKDPPAAAAILGSNRQLEHELLNRIRKNTKLPVSKSFFVEMDPTVFGEPAMIIERVRGSGEPSALFNGGHAADQAERVATELCELVAHLHMTDPAILNPDGMFDDPRGAGIDPSSWDRYMDTTLEYYIRGYDEIAFDPLPGWLDALLHMRRNKPRPLPMRLVHGDFNPANFLYEDGHVTAIIDWENSHMGDPREDLGWLKHMDVLSNTNVFGSVKEDGGFIGHYNKITGFNVTEEEVEYFRMFTSGNIGLPVVSAVKRRLDREHMQLMHLYLVQPCVVSFFAMAQMMGYPMPMPAAPEAN
jgi:aminoglycoside phosphotransferase (APT) family kinase protein